MCKQGSMRAAWAARMPCAASPPPPQTHPPPPATPHPTWRSVLDLSSSPGSSLTKVLSKRMSCRAVTTRACQHSPAVSHAQTEPARTPRLPTSNVRRVLGLASAAAAEGMAAAAAAWNSLLQLARTAAVGSMRGVEARRWWCGDDDERVRWCRAGCAWWLIACVCVCGGGGCATSWLGL